jgi:hypothetical protein
MQARWVGSELAHSETCAAPVCLQQRCQCLREPTHLLQQLQQLRPQLPAQKALNVHQRTAAAAGVLPSTSQLAAVEGLRASHSSLNTRCVCVCVCVCVHARDALAGAWAG